jgi:hypothetical protein
MTAAATEAITTVADLESIVRVDVQSIVRLALGHPPGAAALVLFDRASELSPILAEAYAAALPGVRLMEVSEESRDAVLEALSDLSPGDLVVLAESTRFRLAEHRFRIDLFRRGLKVAEHPHLSNIRAEEIPAYIDSLAYDAGYYRRLGPELKARIDRAQGARLIGPGLELRYAGPLERAKLNIGDYSGQETVGGQFPIGEVFTEAQDLASVSGEVVLFAYGGSDFTVAAPEAPIRLSVEAGRVRGAENAPPEFESILEEIRNVEGEIWLRELGFGLNRAFTRERRVSDVGSYERMCGIHLSLGAKHAIYAKAGFSKRRVKYHVDVFAAIERAEIDGETVYQGGRYTI